MNATHEQPELDLQEKAAAAVERDSVEDLCTLLQGRGWTTAAKIREIRPEWKKRFIRLLARLARPRIVSGPGSKGYCLADEVSDAALLHTGRSLLSQGRDMSRSGIGYLRLHALRAKTKDIIAAMGGNA